MSQNETLAALSAAGVSVWLDDLSRDRLNSGNLAELRDTKSVVGVTTNPSIFQAALSAGHAYDAQVAELAERGADVEATIRTVTTDDVREACDLFAEVYTATGGVDGRVSIEVDPRLARDTDKTILQAMELWKIVDRPNLLIKIPATEAGLPAITAVIGEGISVNVTLIFSVERHRAVMDAYLAGLAAANEAGHDLSQDSFGGVVLRLPGGHRDRQTVGADRHRGGAWRCAVRPASPTPGWRMPPIRRYSSVVTVLSRSRPRARGFSVRCGPRRG